MVRAFLKGSWIEGGKPPFPHPPRADGSLSWGPVVGEEGGLVGGEAEAAGFGGGGGDGGVLVPGDLMVGGVEGFDSGGGFFVAGDGLAGVGSVGVEDFGLEVAASAIDVDVELHGAVEGQVGGDESAGTSAGFETDPAVASDGGQADGADVAFAGGVLGACGDVRDEEAVALLDGRVVGGDDPVGVPAAFAAERQDGVTRDGAMPAQAVVGPDELGVESFDGFMVDFGEAEETAAVAERLKAVDLDVARVEVVMAEDDAAIVPMDEVGALPEVGESRFDGFILPKAQARRSANKEIFVGDVVVEDAGSVADAGQRAGQMGFEGLAVVAAEEVDALTAVAGELIDVVGEADEAGIFEEGIDALADGGEAEVVAAGLELVGGSEAAAGPVDGVG